MLGIVIIVLEHCTYCCFNRKETSSFDRVFVLNPNDMVNKKINLQLHFMFMNEYHKRLASLNIYVEMSKTHVFKHISISHIIRFMDDFYK